VLATRRTLWREGVYSDGDARPSSAVPPGCGPPRTWWPPMAPTRPRRATVCCGHSAADPHFWTMAGRSAMAQLCDAWGRPGARTRTTTSTLSLAMFTHVAARPRPETSRPSTRTGSAGRRRADEAPIPLVDGHLTVPAAPGLGANSTSTGWQGPRAVPAGGARRADDTVAMQYLVPGWKFDPKRPALESA